jgi:4'-phosphopantetheinyl transferase EntD
VFGLACPCPDNSFKSFNLKIELNLPNSVFGSCFSTDFYTETELMPAEKLLARSWASKRIMDFSTGRYCAREALNELGITGAEILIGTQREPLWPIGMVGSISHAEGFAGAIVGDEKTVMSIGLDIESLGRVKKEMWYLLFTNFEQEFLNQWPLKLQEYYSTAFFSLKESFYKFQFPLTRTFLNFTDVEIDFFDERFEIKILKALQTQVDRTILNPVLDCISFDQYVIATCYLLR